MKTTIQQQSKAREQRAKAILTKGNPEALDEYTYLVPSQFDESKKSLKVPQIRQHHGFVRRSY